MYYKNQLLSLKNSKSGFTLFELMVVIIIIGIFFTATMVFQGNGANDAEKATRLMDKISGIIRDETIGMSIGKMPKRDGRVANKVIISIDKNTGIKVNYYFGANLIGSGLFMAPYFDGDKNYVIRDIVGIGSSDNTKNRGYNPVDITLEGGNITLSGADASNTLLGIEAGYYSGSQYMTLDRRTGRIETSSKKTY